MISGDAADTSALRNPVTENVRPRISAGTTSAVIAVRAGKPATTSSTPMTAIGSFTASGVGRNTMMRNTAPNACVTPATTIGAPSTRPRSRSVRKPPSSVPARAPIRMSPPATPAACPDVSDVWREKKVGPQNPMPASAPDAIAVPAMR